MKNSFAVYPLFNEYFAFSVHSPPRIIKQPIAEEMLFQVASYGDTEKPFIIECEAEGEPAPKWVLCYSGYFCEHSGMFNPLLFTNSLFPLY